MENLIKAYLINQADWFADEVIQSVEPDIQDDEQCYTVVFVGTTPSEYIKNSELLTFLFECY
tara:strand:- start:9562 stop:9747 length:186 start_codon:yes stop_codon:yes gene_type:complete